MVRHCAWFWWILAFSVAIPLFAHAQKYRVLYEFTGGSDGGSPNGPVSRDKTGNLYSSTFRAGDLNCDAPLGCGTLFRLGVSGSLDVFHTFTGAEGEGPLWGLVADGQGNGYGTASGGGNLSCSGQPPGCGTVYKVDSKGRVSVLHSFSGADGQSPSGALLRDATGNLYGTTVFGGTDDQGVAFKIDLTGNETVLQNFSGANGSYPSSGLIGDSAGNLYGTTSEGGLFGQGAVFELTPTSGGWAETVLYSFAGGPPDGKSPSTNLVRDAKGNLYGTTIWGGSSSADYCSFGCGTIFELMPTSGGWKETELYSFTGGSDGAFPHGLARDPAGVLYGTTSAGGSGTVCCGTVFAMNSAGKLTTLHTFTGPEGANPASVLLLDTDIPAMYGTTSTGGDLSCNTPTGAGCGVVFTITR